MIEVPSLNARNDPSWPHSAINCPLYYFDLFFETRALDHKSNKPMEKRKTSHAESRKHGTCECVCVCACVKANPERKRRDNTRVQQCVHAKHIHTARGESQRTFQQRTISKIVVKICRVVRLSSSVAPHRRTRAALIALCVLECKLDFRHTQHQSFGSLPSLSRAQHKNCLPVAS